MERKKASNRVEMVGNTYNSWKVLEHSHTNNKIAYYKCECLECNQEFIVDGRNVRNGLSKRCVACGFGHRDFKQRGAYKTKKSPKELSEYYLMLSKIKSGKSRSHDWELTQTQFNGLIYQNCHYCNSSPNTTVNPTRGHSLAKSRLDDCFITYNGIDRIDSSKGYIAGNVVPCCEYCNKSKLDRSYEEFKAWINKLHAHINR